MQDLSHQQFKKENRKEDCSISSSVETWPAFSSSCTYTHLIQIHPTKLTQAVALEPTSVGTSGFCSSRWQRCQWDGNMFVEDIWCKWWVYFSDCNLLEDVHVPSILDSNLKAWLNESPLNHAWCHLPAAGAPAWRLQCRVHHMRHEIMHILYS